MVKNRQKQGQLYLASEVDPLLKPCKYRGLTMWTNKRSDPPFLCEVIKKAVRGKGAFPPDFGRWLWMQLCQKYSQHGAEGKQGSAISAIQSLQDLIEKSDEYFSVLGQGDYKSTISAWEQLSSAAAITLASVLSFDQIIILPRTITLVHRCHRQCLWRSCRQPCMLV